jgi:hypothetical protein
MLRLMNFTMTKVAYDNEGIPGIVFMPEVLVCQVSSGFRHLCDQNRKRTFTIKEVLGESQEAFAERLNLGKTNFTDNPGGLLPPRLQSSRLPHKRMGYTSKPQHNSSSSTKLSKLHNEPSLTSLPFPLLLTSTFDSISNLVITATLLSLAKTATIR